MGAASVRSLTFEPMDDGVYILPHGAGVLHGDIFSGKSIN
jgi:hypothetical protein